MIDKAKYFSRMGIDENTEISESIEFLNLLNYRNCVSIPYENLDLVDGKLLSLNSEDVLEKVCNNRGGYCFEINGLLSNFLKENGFEVTNYLGRFLRGMDTIPVRHHRVLKVKCRDEYYVMDVSIGQSSPLYPLKLEEGLIQEQFGEKYKFEKDSFLGWVLYDLHNGEWRKFYSFTEDEQLDIDFILPSFYCERHPASKFNKFPIVGLKTDTGRKTINDRCYKVFENGEITYILENMSDELRNEILEKEFGIKWRK